MKTLKLKKENDVSHSHIAMPAHVVFGVKAVSKRKTDAQEKEQDPPCHINFIYSLHIQPFICSNVRINKLKKTP